MSDNLLYFTDNVKYYVPLPNMRLSFVSKSDGIPVLLPYRSHDGKSQTELAQYSKNGGDSLNNKPDVRAAGRQGRYGQLSGRHQILSTGSFMISKLPWPMETSSGRCWSEVTVGECLLQRGARSPLGTARGHSLGR